MALTFNTFHKPKWGKNQQIPPLHGTHHEEKMTYNSLSYKKMRTIYHLYSKLPTLS